MDLKDVGAALGAVGGALGFWTWFQGQADRRTKRRSDKEYEEWLAGLTAVLIEIPGADHAISAEESAWAARAVSEGRLRRGPVRGTVVLP